ncbi:MAG: N-acetylmuramoyl-L-alanine amidase [Verrucomicrobia bacterium]|nr:N-acetylmuramoyl-L-alanine amidase [Verrucomicrobiota bacterium]
MKTGLIGLLAVLLLLTACHTRPPEPRRGDEIVVAGQFFHTGARVLTWMDPGGFNAYPGDGRNYNPRRDLALRTLPALQKRVDQFVIHYDDCGLSSISFAILQKRRLSVHFLIDVDGTIYQTLDLVDAAQHATIANSRSVGVELAGIGAQPPGQHKVFDQWYQRDATGRTLLRLPAHAPLTYTGGPIRPDLVRGEVQGKTLEQYDFTPEQYAALAKLTAALCRALPLIACDYPRDAAGRLMVEKIPDAAYEKFHGVLGHYHIQENKIDPGPAFQWDKVISEARALLKSKAP